MAGEKERDDAFPVSLREGEGERKIGKKERYRGCQWNLSSDKKRERREEREERETMRRIPQSHPLLLYFFPHPGTLQSNLPHSLVAAPAAVRLDGGSRRKGKDKGEDEGEAGERLPLSSSSCSCSPRPPLLMLQSPHPLSLQTALNDGNGGGWGGPSEGTQRQRERGGGKRWRLSRKPRGETE